MAESTPPPPILSSGFNRLKQCRHGLLLYNVNDRYIGRSLDLYGEFSEEEVTVFQHVLRPGMVVLDVGANIGAFTVPFAQIVGAAGAVFAFEPQRLVFQTLCANVALNSFANVACQQVAVGSAPGQVRVPVLDPTQAGNFGGLELSRASEGETVPVITVDGLGLPHCHFLKVDVEGMEIEVLQGAIETIRRLHPVLYVESDREDAQDALLSLLRSLDYRAYLHRPPLYRRDNFFGNPMDVFDRGGVPLISQNLLCIHRSIPGTIGGLEEITR